MGMETIGKAAWTATRLDVLTDQGSAGHPLPARLIRTGPQRPLRDLADAVHHLCLLHGRRPGVVDHAGLHTTAPAARDWLMRAIDGFAGERTALTQLVVAAGPLPPTPGHGETEITIAAQRHALDMLSQSDRTGCAIGAAMALVADWQAVRPVLWAAGEAFGVALPRPALPSEAETTAMAAALVDTAAVDRAFRFGASQLLAQQHGLWTLLAARIEARGDD